MHHDTTDFRSAKFQEICTQDVDLRGGEFLSNKILKIFLQGVVFFEKGKFFDDIANDFRLPTSHSDNSLMI